MGDALDEARARELLAAERARIERQLAGVAQPDEDTELAHGDQHLVDEASDLYEDELRVGRIDDLREQLRAVERSEERPTSGTWGSVDSGLAIPDEPLEVEPTAERTVEGSAPERWPGSGVGSPFQRSRRRDAAVTGGMTTSSADIASARRPHEAQREKADEGRASP